MLDILIFIYLVYGMYFAGKHLVFEDTDDYIIKSMTITIVTLIWVIFYGRLKNTNSIK